MLPKIKEKKRTYINSVINKSKYTSQTKNQSFFGSDFSYSITPFPYPSVKGIGLHFQLFHGGGSCNLSVSPTIANGLKLYNIVFYRLLKYLRTFQRHQKGNILILQNLVRLTVFLRRFLLSLKFERVLKLFFGTNCCIVAGGSNGQQPDGRRYGCRCGCC